MPRWVKRLVLSGPLSETLSIYGMFSMRTNNESDLDARITRGLMHTYLCHPVYFASNCNGKANLNSTCCFSMEVDCDCLYTAFLLRRDEEAQKRFIVHSLWFLPALSIFTPSHSPSDEYWAY